MPSNEPTYSAFAGARKIAHGPLHIVAVAVKHAGNAGILVFDDTTGKSRDLDTRGTDDEVRARYAPPPEVPRGRGRPKLGVVPREVTLLPRHWEFLNAQPGGASAALRKLIDEARKTDRDTARARKAAHEAAYHFMHAVAGDFPGYEEAIRALFADDHARFAQCIAHWPTDVRTHALQLGFTSTSDTP